MVPRLLAITPPRGVIDPELVDAWLDAGGRTLGIAVLLREPGLGLAQLLASERLAGLRRRLAERGIPALASVDAHELDGFDHAEPPLAGVQLRGDPSRATLARVRPRVSGLLGRSCHGLQPTEPEADDLVDYSVLAPIFTPMTDQPGVVKTPIGLEGLRGWLGRPNLLALGGITPANAASVLEAGATGVAGISLVFAGLRDAADNVAALVRIFAAAAQRPASHVPPPR